MIWSQWKTAMAVLVVILSAAGAGGLAQQEPGNGGGTRIASPAQSVEGVTPAQREPSQPRWHEATIESKLDRSLQFNLSNVPLAAALAYLKTQAGLNFVLDPKAHPDGNVLAKKVTLVTEGNPIRIKNGLDLILNPLGLGYRVVGRVVLISSFAAEPRREEVVFFDVAALLPAPSPARGKANPSREDAAALTELLVSSVAPGSWNGFEADPESRMGPVSDRPGSIEFFPAGRMLAVRHRPEVQDQVGRWLERLRRLRYGTQAPNVRGVAGPAPVGSEKASSVTRKIYVPLVHAPDLPRSIALMMTELVIKDIERSTPYKVVPSLSEADYVLGWTLRPVLRARQSGPRPNY